MKEIFEKLENNSGIKEWREKNKEDYLSSMFLTCGKDKPNNDWQIDFYNKEKDKMHSFILKENGDVEPMLDNDIFKEKEKVVNPLNLEDVKISYEDAINNANAIMKEKHPGEDVNKQIIILQNLEQLVWNITFLTSCFNLLTIKVDAVTGEILKEEFGSLMSFGPSN